MANDLTNCISHNTHYIHGNTNLCFSNPSNIVRFSSKCYWNIATSSHWYSFISGVLVKESIFWHIYAHITFIICSQTDDKFREYILIKNTLKICAPTTIDIAFMPHSKATKWKILPKKLKKGQLNWFILSVDSNFITKVFPIWF